MTDIIAKRSEFDIFVTRADDRLIATDPITIKNQIQEIHSIDDLGLNTQNRVDGSLVTWNANTNSYYVKPFNTYIPFSWSNTHIFNANVTFNSAILANNSPGLSGQVLTSNGLGVYWANVSPYVFDSGFIVNNNIVSVNTAYIATLTSNNSSYLNGKTETALNVNSALTSNNTAYAFGKTEANLNVNSSVYSTNAMFANSATYLGGFTSSYFAANSSLANYYLASNPSGYITSSASITGSANSATYLGGKTELDLNVNSASFASIANSAAYLNNKSESDLNTNSALIANNAAYLNGKTEASLNANSALTSNNTAYLSGKLEANLNVNSAVYSTNASLANNTTYINGKTDTYFTDATNLVAGTLAEPRLPYRMNQNVTTTSSVQFKDLQLSGTLTIGSNVNVISANNLYVTDNMIYMNANAYNINPDIGLAAGYYDGTYHHTGFFRDHTNGTWKVFDNYKPEPDASIYIDQSNSTFHLANFMANTIFVGNNSVYGTITTTNFTGTANNATYAFGKTESELNANSATYLGGNPSSFFAANSSLANYYLANNPAGYVNSTSGSANSALFSNNAAFLAGNAPSFFAANSSLANYYLATNPAGYVNSTSGSANSALFSNNANRLSGKLEVDLNVNNAIFANNSTYLNGKTDTFFAANSSLANYYLATNPAGYVNSTSGSANNSLFANNSNYLNGKTDTFFAANSSLANYYLATNPAGYITSSANITGSANSATYLGGKLEANLNVNSAVYATNAQFSYTANSATYFGGATANAYQTTAGLTANIAAYLPTYRGVLAANDLFIANSIVFTDSTSGYTTTILGNPAASSSDTYYWPTSLSGGGQMWVDATGNMYLQNFNYNGSYNQSTTTNTIVLDTIPQMYGAVFNQAKFYYTPGAYLGFGSLPINTTYYFVMVAYDAYGNPVISSEFTGTTTSTFRGFSIQGNVNPALTNYQFWFGTTSGGQNKYFSVTPVGPYTNYSFLTTTGATSGTLPSSVNKTASIQFSTVIPTYANTSQTAWGTNGIGLIIVPSKYTDNTTAASGTVATSYMNLFGTQTYAASNTGVTVTNLYGTYFQNPANGTNVTATNKFAIGADSLSTTSFTANSTQLRIVSVPLYANGSAGTSAQVLTSNGTSGSPYWTTPTTYSTGNGLTNSGSQFSVNANNGIIANSTGVFVNTSVVTTLTDSQNLTNKRINHRVSSIANTATITPDISAYDMYIVSALSVGLTINIPVGTPVEGDRLLFRLKDNGTVRTLTMNTNPGGFRALGGTLPTTLPANTAPAGTAGKLTYAMFVYNSIDNYWDMLSNGTGG